MPYIGRDLNRGNYLKLDDISSSFNGSTQTFNLTVGGSAFTPGSAFSILVSLGGVIQEPESAYQVSNSEITFANAPTAQDSFFCIALGVALGIGVPGNGTVNGTQMSKPFNYDGFFYLNDGTNRVGINSSIPSETLDIVGNTKISGILTASTYSGPIVNASGISTFYDLRVSNNLTVEGTTTTLDTNLIGVDRIEVGANSNTVVGVAITQSGTADILNLYDGSTEVFSVKDGGSVRVGDNATYSANTGADDLVIGATTGQHGLTILTGNNSSSINFADSAAVNPGAITYQHNGTNYMLFRVAGSEKVRILADGKVGIGTDNPDSLLHLYSSSTMMKLEDSDGTSQWSRLAQIGSNLKIQLRNGSNNGTFGIQGYGGGTPTDFVNVDSDGKVGIGTNTPDANLTVHADAADQTAFTVHADMGTNNNRTFNLKTPATDSGSEPFVIHTANALSVQIDSTEEFRINDGGLVGIGTKTPATKLHVTTTSASSTPLTLERTHNNNVIVKYQNPTLSMYAGLAGEGLGWGVGDSPDLGNPNNIQLMVNSTGRIGIGTIVPETLLTIAKNATNQTTGTIPTVRLTNLDTTAVASDIVGSYEFFSKDVHSLNKVTGFMRNTPTDAGVNYDLTFGTIKTGDSNAVERLRIKSDGDIYTSNDQVRDSARLTITKDHVGISTALFLHNSSGSGTAAKISSSKGLVLGADVYANSGAGESFISFETDNSEKLRITSDGKVGIGTDAPAHALDIQGSSGSFTKLALSNQTMNTSKYEIIFGDQGQVNHIVKANREFTIGTNNLERLRIDSDGRLLVSRSGLTASRNVGTKTGEIQIASSGNSSAFTMIGFSNDAAAPHLMFGKSRAGNATGSTIVQEDDRLGEIAFCGADGTDIDSFGAAIKAFVDGTPGANDMPGRLSFFTTLDGYSTPTERMVIKNDGSVGIGTDSPGGAQVRIHRDGLNKILQQWGGKQGSTAGQRFIELYSPSNDDVNDYFRFQTGNAVKFRIDSTNALCISSASKIGIGTDTPDTPLHIYANDAQQITVERAAATNSAIRYRNTVASMYAGLTSNATGFAIDNNDDLGVDPMFFVERSTGHVGINQIPTDYPLEVKQKSADGGALRLRDSASNFRYLDFDVTGALTQITARSNLSHGRIDIGTLSQYGRQTRLYIHSDGNVGIATNDPNTELEVFDEAFANITIHSARTSGNIGGIDFRKGGTAAGIQTAQYFVNTNGEHFFHSQGSEKLKIQSDGSLKITDGNIVVANGHGINFSSTSNVGSLGSELLDDYESGTYTPTLTLGSGSVTSTTSGTLSYVKIGRLVQLFGRLHFGTSTSDVTSFDISLPIANTGGHAYDTSTVFHVIRGSGGEPAAGIRIFRADTGGTTMKMQNANGQVYGNLGATNPHINVNFSYFSV